MCPKRPSLFSLAVLVWSTLVYSGAQAQEDFFSAPGAKQDPVEEITATITPAEARRGETVTLKITVRMIPDWHTYPTKALQTDPKAAIFSTDLKLVDAAGLEPGKLKDPPNPLVKPEPALEIKALRYYEETATWEWPLIIPEKAEPGKKTVKVRLKTQVCHDKKGCIPQDKTLDAFVTVSDAAPVARAAVAPPMPADDAAARPDKPGQPAGSSGLWAFVLQGIIWGGLTLVTPCVFPMIPITVSYFLKQSEREHHRPITMAVVYSGTIVAVLTLGALLFIEFCQALSQTATMNFVLGILFVAFALSLFGMFEIRLPASLARFTSAHEGQGGLVGTMFMALTFTVVSFTCVAPFLGGFAGLTVQARPWWEKLLGAAAFAVTFASPFMVLALFPNLLRMMPKSGSWLNNVKVVMGFLELAAALKFLRAGELIARPEGAQVLTYDLVMGMYVALSIICGIYLLNLFRLEHDTPSEHLGVGRLLFSIFFLSVGLYLLPGLLKQRPNGVVFEWLDSFVLPDTTETEVAEEGAQAGGLATRRNEGLPWIGNFQKALAQAQDSKKLIFIDFTGKT